MKKLLETSKKVNYLEAQIAESDAKIAKVENWNFALSQQLEEAQLQVQDKEDFIKELQDQQKEVKQQKKAITSQNEKQLKEQIKQLNGEVNTMREEWWNPS